MTVESTATSDYSAAHRTPASERRVATAGRNGEYSGRGDRGAGTVPPEVRAYRASRTVEHRRVTRRD